MTKEELEEELATERGAAIFHGKPCRKGHGTLKYKSTKGCVMCAREQAVAWSKAKRARAKGG